jgi:hypothetical protein
MLLTLTAASGIDEDSPHGFRGRGEEVRATIPLLLGRRSTDQAKVRFVNQPRGIQRQWSRLFRQSIRSELAQLVLHDRQELPFYSFV